MTGTAATGSRPAREATGSAMREQSSGLEEGRRRSRKGSKKKDKDKEKPTAGGGKGKEQRRRKSGDGGAAEGSGGGRNGDGWRQPAQAPLAWAPADGTKGRQEEFRAPGELGDDFFGGSDSSGNGSDSSGAAVSALTAYAGLDSTAAATSVPRAFVPSAPAAPAPTYAAGYAAPRRMEGFGGGGRSVARGMGPGAPPSLTGGTAQQPMRPRCVSYSRARKGASMIGGGERCDAQSR